MASTIDSIAPGRFGINLVTGWQKAEYDQMGLWPGEAHYKTRYRYLAEYATVLRELLETGKSDFKGEYFTMNDCRVSPTPKDTKIICAGSSDEGLAFTAQYADYAFALGKGTNTPTAFAPVNTRLEAAAAKTGRDVKSYILFMIIADETDEKAMAKWRLYRDGADQGGAEVADRPGRAERGGGGHDQHRPARRRDLGGEPQHGDAGGQLRKRRPDARRGGLCAGHRRRPAHLRRFPEGHRRLRPEDPAADGLPQGAGTRLTGGLKVAALMLLQDRR
ncbi:LLM class flavin-dependent oxidoreductase [Phenylobacterium sp. J367]|uniref:LLM class flavin-dependent oxidoreductase n=1 Tax=Phenylobacterium sp. J367 TaxID=2898435 RepID=UPI002151CA00|nr:LLM class flavin-dependent oxidoreductase [Phenylobacterium sp. J367]MCR5880369.1 LLM class flavin-dependent oxidoreductase [Phenylobacterium sp. J367]